MFKKLMVRVMAESIVEVMVEVLQDRAANSRSVALKNVVKTISNDKEQLKAEVLAKVA